MEQQDLLTQTIAPFKKYADERVALLKLQVVERTAVLGSGLISSTLIAVAAVLFLLCLTLTTGFFLSEQLGSYYAGFGVVSLFFLLVFICMFLARERFLNTFLRNQIVRVLVTTT
jgi:hypothetical protein